MTGRKGKLVWLVLSCLMALSLLLAACTPAAEEPTAPTTTASTTTTSSTTTTAAKPVEKEEVTAKGPEMVEWTGTKLDGTVVTKMMEVPQYGGVLRRHWFSDSKRFDIGAEGSATGGTGYFG